MAATTKKGSLIVNSFLKRLTCLKFTLFLCAHALFLWPCAFGQEPATPIRLAPGLPYLFVDDLLVDTQQNIHRTLHQPVKDGGGNEAAITLLHEFEEYSGTLEANGSIVFDPNLQRYVMFAIGYSPQWRAKRVWDYVRLYRFTSPDGITWQKGDDGTPESVWPRTPDDLVDALSGDAASNIDMFSCYYDPQHADFPYRGWLHFANWGNEREGIYFMRSSDGKTWERGPMVVNACGGSNDPSAVRRQVNGVRLQGPGDVTLFSHDPISSRFLGLFKFYSPDDTHPTGNLFRSRAYAFIESPDRVYDPNAIDAIDLVPAGALVNGDVAEDEYYGSSAWRYGSHWLGGLKVFHLEGDQPWSAAGCAFLKFAYSRDGLDWTKAPYENEAGQPEIWLANGPEGGNSGRNDGGYMTEFSQGPLRVNDDLIYYYAASSFGKNAGKNKRITGGGIFRARMRVDGFVSIDSGTLTTRLLEAPLTPLHVNAVGPIEVQVLSTEGAVVEKLELRGDSLRHPVPVPAGPFRLKFALNEGARLYSLTLPKHVP